MPVRTGSQYLEGLRRRPRELWLGGERVSDPTDHPALRRGAQTIAELYDVQADPANREALTYPSPTSGEPVALSFLMPGSAADLQRQGRAIKQLADHTCGMLGRSPDFMNKNIMAFAAIRDHFARGGEQFGQHIWAYYEFIREHDLCLTHSLVNPQSNRAAGPAAQPDPYLALGIVEKNGEGIVVRGARMLATLAPFADEVVIAPSTVLQTTPEEAKHALCFALPADAPGLKFVCREPLDLGWSSFDHPLGSRFDEMDAMLIFDDVLVPWERVFIAGDVLLCNTLTGPTGTMQHLMHQFCTRFLAKAEFVVGLTCLIAETIAIEGFLHVQEKLGEMINDTELIRAGLRAAELDAELRPNGVAYPALEPLAALRGFFPKVYPRMVEILQLLGAGGMMMVPTRADLDGPLAEAINRYYQAARAPARDRVQLFKLAWDVAGTGFGSRQVLYERYFSGDPVRVTAGRYVNYDKAPLMARVREFLQRAEG